MDKEQKIERRKKLSTICKGLGFILLAFMLFMPKWFVMFPILLIFASWGFYIDGQHLVIYLNKPPISYTFYTKESEKASLRATCQSLWRTF